MPPPQGGNANVGFWARTREVYLWMAGVLALVWRGAIRALHNSSDGQGENGEDHRTEPGSAGLSAAAARSEATQSLRGVVPLRRWGVLPDQEATVVGYLLREAREAAAMTQTDLAARLGCTQQAVSQAEGWLSNPTIDFVRRWAAAAGADLELSLPRARPLQGSAGRRSGSPTGRR